jgi:hypothetical protein
MDITSLPQVNRFVRELKSFQKGKQILSDQLNRQGGATRTPQRGGKIILCCQELLTDPLPTTLLRRYWRVVRSSMIENQARTSSDLNFSTGVPGVSEAA